MTTLADLRALTAVTAERVRQDAKWGEQNHPDGTGPDVQALHLTEVNLDLRTGAELASIFRDSTDRKARTGGLTFLDILLEEIFEAAAESNPEPLRDELTQSAAVIAAWLGAIERRTPRRERVYISGPIANDPDAQATFAVAADRIDDEFHEAVNPFTVAPLSHPGEPCGRGYQPGMAELEHTSSACFMRTDLLALLSCDSIYMLPGWENSKGAKVELAVADACGMGITYAEGAEA